MARDGFICKYQDSKKKKCIKEQLGSKKSLQQVVRVNGMVSHI